MIESVGSGNHIPISIQFPSFAPSLQTSPEIKKSGQSSTFQSLNSPEVHKISIHLPEELLEEEGERIEVQSSKALRQRHVARNTASSFEDCNNKQNYNFSKAHRGIDVGACDESGKSPITNNIKVYCRMREAKRSEDCLRHDHTMIDDGQNCYSFDYVFHKDSTQRQIYQRVALRHVNDFFLGKNSTIFAYGQTGSGKTHTMFGNMEKSNGYGLIPRALQEIFLRDLSNNTITCSMLEIYNEKLYDLFNPLTNSYSEIKLKEVNDYIFLEGLQEILVENKEQILGLIGVGHRGRRIAATFSNDVSSRSHTILFVYRNFVCKGQEYRAKLCFIDLAGSQKVKKSGAKGQTLEETKKINLSLSCLGNVVHALTNGSDHIPYRNSKLTRILKDSLATETNTSIITTCSLEKSDHHETVSTIKFAVRAKRIKNKKKLENQGVPLEEQFEMLKRELEETKKQLAHYREHEKQCKLLASGSSIAEHVPIGSITWSECVRQLNLQSDKKAGRAEHYAKNRQRHEHQHEARGQQTEAGQIAEESVSFEPLRSLHISKGISSRIYQVGGGENHE